MVLIVAFFLLNVLQAVVGKTEKRQQYHCFEDIKESVVWTTCGIHRGTWVPQWSV